MPPDSSTALCAAIERMQALLKEPRMVWRNPSPANHQISMTLEFP